MASAVPAGRRKRCRKMKQVEILAQHALTGYIEQLIPTKFRGSTSPNDKRNNFIMVVSNLVRYRYSVPTAFSKAILDRLKERGVGKDDIAEELLNSNCPLDFIILMQDHDITRKVIRRKQMISQMESEHLIQLSMLCMSWKNIEVLIEYGPGADYRREIFSTKMFFFINHKDANVETSKRYIDMFMASNIIRVCSLQFLEDTFECGATETVRLLLDCKISEYVKKTLGHDLLAHMFVNQRVDVAGLLRGRQFDANAKCRHMSALHFATFFNVETNVRFLLNSGADPNIRDRNGMTPLFAFGDRKCIELLLQNGADVQSIAHNGYTILHMMFHPDLVGLIVAHIALIEARGVTIKEEIREVLSRPTFIDFYEKCCKQIERAGELRIRDGFTFLTALIGEPECFAGFISEQNIVVELIGKCRSLKLHSYYLATMERNIDKAFFIFNLRCASVDILLPIFDKTQFSEFMIRKIVDYLTFAELQLLV